MVLMSMFSTLARSPRTAAQCFSWAKKAHADAEARSEQQQHEDGKSTPNANEKIREKSSSKNKKKTQFSNLRFKFIQLERTQFDIVSAYGEVFVFANQNEKQIEEISYYTQFRSVRSAEWSEPQNPPKFIRKLILQFDFDAKIVSPLKLVASLALRASLGITSKLSTNENRWWNNRKWEMKWKRDCRIVRMRKIDSTVQQAFSPRSVSLKNGKENQRNELNMGADYTLMICCDAAFSSSPRFMCSRFRFSARSICYWAFNILD